LKEVHTFADVTIYTATRYVAKPAVIDTNALVRGVRFTRCRYDTWTDCGPTSRWNCQTLQVLTCKALSSMICLDGYKTRTAQ